MKIGAIIRGLAGAILVASAASCAAILEPADGFPEVGDDPRALPDKAVHKNATCGVDEMREHVCGSLASPVDATADAPFWDCPLEPKMLTSAGPTVLFYTDLKRVEFDRRMTLKYREELNARCGDGADIERKGQCCYSRCTPLPTAAAATRTTVPEGYHEKAQCIDAPQGGTMYPSSDYADCPSALAFAQGVTPFEADPLDVPATAEARARGRDHFSGAPRCCYRTLEADQ